jgi:hypothetical protein
MADATEKKPDNARNKAYAAATTRLRDLNREQFNLLLEEEYGKLGLTPRRRRTAEEIAAEAAAKEQIKAEKAEMKRLEKIAKLQAEMEALMSRDEVAMEVFKEPASV